MVFTRFLLIILTSFLFTLNSNSVEGKFNFGNGNNGGGSCIVSFIFFENFIK
jgi:hypothetical protein